MAKKLVRCVSMLLFLVICMTQSGCWSRTEINEMAIVTTLALDKTENGMIRLAVEIARPSVIAGSAKTGGGEGGGAASVQPVIQIASTGETPYDAWRNLDMQVGKMMFFAHTENIVIGERLAREGISQYLDFTERRFRLRRNIILSFTPGEAKEVLVSTPLLDNTMGEGLESLVARSTRQSKTYISTLNDFYADLLSETTNPTATKLNVYLLDPETGHRHVKLAGAAVFKGDKLTGWLNEKETRGLNRIKGVMGRGTVPVQCNGSNYVSIITNRSSTEIKPVIRGGQLVIQVKVSEEGDIGDQECSKNYSTPENLAALDEAYTEAIREEVEAAIIASQKVYGIDILGFGEAVRRHHTKFWKDNNLTEKWPAIFPSLPVELAVEGKVRRPGLTLAPAVIP